MRCTSSLSDTESKAKGLKPFQTRLRTMTTLNSCACRGVYLAAIFYHHDSLLVTAEDQIPIVEVDDSYSSSLMHDFLWFTKVTSAPILSIRPGSENSDFEARRFLRVQLSCMWEDVRWLRQTTSVSTSASSTLQIRHKLLTAAGQLQVRHQVNPCSGWPLHFDSHGVVLLQSMLGTHNLGRVHYEPIKDRHGNVLLVTIRDTENHHSVFSGKWMQVSKLQSQRKSMSTPEEPYALDILIITIQVRKHAAPGFLGDVSFSH